ncbi:hypothetical protein ACJD0Z_18560 [Flavobacteriaceae bacterium M23B6Z8]
MMKNNVFALFILSVFFSVITYGQEEPANQYKYYVGSSLFTMANLFSDPPHFYQLNVGYRITQKDVVSFEAITWTYDTPLGREYGSDISKDEARFPGEVKAFGAGIAYQRFLWKQLYAQVHATALHQNYRDPSGDKIQSGFQLFNTFRIGYQFRFFKNRVFLEPSLGVTWWPVNTNLPEAFQRQEDRFNNYLIGEPGLHFGINF